MCLLVMKNFTGCEEGGRSSDAGTLRVFRPMHSPDAKAPDPIRMVVCDDKTPKIVLVGYVNLAYRGSNQSFRILGNSCRSPRTRPWLSSGRV